jgi:hypothetical protein
MANTSMRISLLKIIAGSFLLQSQPALSETPIKREPPYPPDYSETNEELGTIIVETEDGDKEVKHPWAKKGLKRITRKNQYIFEKEDTTEEERLTNTSLKSANVQEISEEGVYTYKEVKPDTLINNSSLKNQGVARILENGTYIFNREPSEYESSLSIQLGSSPGPEITRSLDGAGDITYKDIYGEMNTSGIYIQKRYPLTRRNIFWHWGFGVNQQYGQGVFVNDGSEALETIEFLLVPTEVGIGTNLIFSDTQWLNSYITVGGGIIGVAELRSDIPDRSILSYVPSATVTFGLALSMKALDSIAIRRMDTLYGVNNIWITLEGRRNQAFDESLDVSSNIASLGLVIDF